MHSRLNPNVAVLGTGSYLPERVVTNLALRDLCGDAYDEDVSGDFSTWVDRVTHIHERRYIAEGQTAGLMAVEAARGALDMAGVKPGELDLIIHCSFTPSVCVPGDHVQVAEFLGAKTTPNFTLTGACAGSIQGMALAYGMIASGVMRRILITGSETISPTLDYSDPLTSILFADGAGAVVMGGVESSEGGTFPPSLGFEYSWHNILMQNANMPFGAKVREPARDGAPPTIEKTFIKMTSGPSVLRNAVNTMARSVRKSLGAPDDSEFAELRPRLRVIPHQANGRIVDGVTRKLSLEPMRVTKTVYRYGNISAASNLIALDFAMRKGNMVADQDPETGEIYSIEDVSDPIRKGEIISLPSIGAGYLFGSVSFVSAI